ncbi:hypothetical protein KIN20_024982 [Parelaphostrongylus tenuis]|uniref:Uncharacterized protein n=1 Tax=Parelaphostrongylus tenuis TaxID=148309 RepID=A0AAD5QX27_PARTN|nr:hypothetical protein KIN20_024982 [Parelaphostrongylus tenuis]
MSDDFDEFVDAIDFERPAVECSVVGPSPRSETTVSTDSTTDVPIKSHDTDEAKAVGTRSYSCSPERDIVQSSALFTTPVVDSSVFSRRDRLTALRRRMREEFGAMDLAPPYGGTATNDCDSISLASEATSMHSWHRRVIASPQTVVVHPSDSVSTRAVPSIPGTSDHTQLSSNTTDEPTGLFVSSSPPTSTPSTTRAPMSPTGPPPSHPPPPLPFTNDLRAPPPLPPRNPSVRLPDPIAVELIARLNASEDADSTTDRPPPVSMSETTHQPPPTQSQKMSSTSNDSLLSSTESRRRGHTKTNSLDRGLTLAKSLKTGPFPPPSNKSNSLTRQEVSDDGEECARNTAAEGVILQITTTLIGDQSPRNGDLEPIASESSSMSSPSSDLSKKMKEVKIGKGKKLARQCVDEVKKVIGKGLW